MKRTIKQIILIVFSIIAIATLFPVHGKKGKEKGPKDLLPEDTVLAIYSIESKGTEASIAEALSPYLVNAVNKQRGKIQIVQNEAVGKALEQQGLAASGACTDSECLPGLGEILGANRFLVTSLSKLGNKYTIFATVYDAESAVSLFSEKEVCRCPVDELDAPVERLANRIMARLNGKKVDKVPTPTGDERISTEVKSDMVYVEEGEFMMGCNSEVNNKCYKDKVPYHKVYLDAYYIDKLEVTVDDYQKCVEDGKCKKAGAFYNMAGDNNGSCSPTGGNYPRNCVDWEQANSYCQWADKRLPTEAEWEKAARGTDGRKYPWGNNMDEQLVNLNDDGLRDPKDGYRGLSPVGSFPGGASPYGALDMMGNVEEWTADIYDKKYYQTSPDRNPKGPSSGKKRVIRGDSIKLVFMLRGVSGRGHSYEGVYTYYTGFRCAKAP